MISGYRAEVDRDAVGQGLTVFIALRVDQHSRETSRLIEDSLAEIPAIVGCHVISGEADFLVEAVVPDLAAYERLLFDGYWRSLRSAMPAAPSSSGRRAAVARYRWIGSARRRQPAPMGRLASIVAGLPVDLR